MASPSDPPAAPPTTFRLAVLVFLPFAAGYLFSYLYRTVNAVIGPDLAAEMSLSAGQLGLLTSAYFIAFAAAQIPVGIFLDSHGPRRVETALLMIAAVGAALFSVGDALWNLALGRALIGLGVAACLMGAFKAMVEWFPKERLPLLNGLIMAFGGMGAMIGTAPTKALVAEIGWRHGFAALALATFLMAVLIWFLVPERTRPGRTDSLPKRIDGVLSVYRSRAFWRIAPLAAMSQGSFLAIQTLWAGPWLRDIAGLDPHAVSLALLAGAGGFVIGNVAIGLAAERLGRRGIAPIFTAGTGMGFFILVQAVVIAEWTASPPALWFTFGAFGTAGVVCFAVLSRAFPPELAGRASTAQNLLIFAAAFGLQWGMGEVINIWPADADGGYAPAGYRAAFGAALALQIMAFAWMVLRRERRSPARAEQ